MAVSRRVRFEVLRRDGYTCRYCGAQAPDVKLTVDHVVPTALGGGDEPSNLVTACQPCNAGKASTAPDQAIVEDVDVTAFMFARALQRAEETRRNELLLMDVLIEDFKKMWDRWVAGPERLPIPLDRDWRSSIERFILNGLDVNDFHRFIERAMTGVRESDGTWKFFCWCCWRELSTRQELARKFIEDGEV